jgi:hypothetical protein
MQVKPGVDNNGIDDDGNGLVDDVYGGILQETTILF